VIFVRVLGLCCYLCVCFLRCLGLVIYVVLFGCFVGVCYLLLGYPFDCCVCCCCNSVV